MFTKLTVALLAVAWPCCAQVSSGTFLARLSKKLNSSSGNLRRGLSSPPAKDPVPDICSLMELHLGEDLVASSMDGGCVCKGNLTDTVELKCSYNDVCEDMFEVKVCADLDLDVKLSGIVDENGEPGPDPKMHIEGCVTTNIQNLEKMCFMLNFAQPDFFTPDSCSFSYGGMECICNIDKTTHCYDFDCSQVVPSENGHVIVADSCKTVDLSNGGDIMMFFPTLGDPSAF